MERVKRLLDPDGILNPGVVLNANPRCHLEDLKPCPTISPLADRCIECGLCEPRCPSRDLTLTPRQRIVVTRELVRLSASREAADAAWRDSLERDFAYDGVQTCAGDSMCQTACPVKIDTGRAREGAQGSVPLARPRRASRPWRRRTSRASPG